MFYESHQTCYTEGLIITIILSAGDRKKAGVREMLEIVPETAERDQCPDRVARSDRRGTDKEIGGAGDAEQFGC